MKYNAQLQTIATPGREGGNQKGLKICQESLGKHTKALRADVKAKGIICMDLL